MKLFTSVTRMPLFSKTSLETVGFSVKRRRKPFLVKNSLTYTSEASELLFKKTVTNFHGTAFNPWRERREEGGGAPGRKVRGFASRRRGGAGEAEQLRNQPPSGAEKLRHCPREPSVRTGGCTLPPQRLREHGRQTPGGHGSPASEPRVQTILESPAEGRASTC